MVVVSQTNRMTILSRTYFRFGVRALARWAPDGLKPGLLTLTLLIALFTACAKSERVVIVYTSHDQIYAEPLLAEFTKETGIKVLPVFDSESVKTAGLAQRLLAEKENPRADIFWSNEEMNSRRLVERGALDADSWARAGFRTRRVVVNTNFVPLADAPQTVDELTNTKWSGKIAVAYPLYGTTAAHMVALRQSWGEARWKKWCEALAANRPFIVDGNSMVVRMVGQGEAWIGLTDSDDFAAGLRNGLPIASAPLKEGSMSIASSVALVKGAPHRAEAEAFYRFAQQRQSIERLVAMNALQSVDAPPSALELKQAARVVETLAELKTIFARQ
jgi:iron(III) transport system substrate-binding protein